MTGRLSLDTVLLNLSEVQINKLTAERLIRNLIILI